MDTKIKIELDAQQANTSVKQLRQELKGVKDEMANLKEGSQAFNDAAKKAGELQHQLTAISEAVRGASSDFGDMVGNIAKAGAGITGAFQAAQGALNLFGVESENVTEAIKKMQSMMAITQGLASIDNGIKAFTKLRTAITSTTGAAKLLKAVLEPKTFLIISAAIGGLVLVWDKFHTQLENNIPLIGKIAEHFRSLKTSTDDATTSQENYTTAVAEAEGKLEELLLNRKISKLNSEAKKSYDELTASIEENQAKLDVIVAKQSQPGISKSKWEELNEEGLKYLDIIRELTKAQNALLNSDNSYIQVQKKKADAIKEVNTAKSDGFDDLYAEIEYNKAINKEYAESKVSLEDLLSVQEQQLATLEFGSAAWYKLATKIEETKKAISNFSDEYKPVAPDVDALTKKLDEQAKETDEFKLSLENIGQIGQIAFGALSDSLYAFAEMQDTTTKEGFEKNKKLQIAATVMNTLSSMVQALAGGNSMASQLGLAAPVGWALGAAQAAATAAMGAAQIVKIKQQQFNSSGSIGGASSGASRASINSSASRVIAPVQYTQDVQGSKLEDTIKSSRVYVTESDITNTQRRVNVAESESRF